MPDLTIELARFAHLAKWLAVAGLVIGSALALLALLGAALAREGHWR